MSSATTAPSELIRDFAREVARDLALVPKQIQSKYLYDALGSSLFESICRLPWYRITRAEARLLTRRASEMVAPIADPVTLLELGCGSGEKIALLAEALRNRRRRVAIHLIDISPTALELSERTLGALEHVSVVGHRATYEEGLRHAARERPPNGGLLVLFLGSNIGNFDSPASQEFLAEIRRALTPRAWAASYRARTFCAAGPRHRRWYGCGSPVRIRGRRTARFMRITLEYGTNGLPVTIPAAHTTVAFERGDWIWTESSYKYEAQGIVDLVRSAGFESHAQWIDPEARFALTLFLAE